MQENLSQKEQLNLLLKNAQLTRAELARIAGVLPNQVSRWNGKAPLPKIVIEYLKLRSENLALKDENTELKTKLIKLLDKI
jgi:hypothetical protein